jgi:hypothetical protein
VNFDKIRKHDGYVYYWRLSDLLELTRGLLSVKIYKQGDCKFFRLKYSSLSFHRETTSGGTDKMNNVLDKVWTYSSPNSSNKIILKSVYSR